MSRPETLERWRQRLERFASTGMTVARFCQSEGVSQAAFYKWRKALRDRNSSATRQSGPSTTSASSEVRFLPLRLSPSAQNRADFATEQAGHEPVARPIAGTTIELPGGVRIIVEVPMVPASEPSGEVEP